MTGIGLCTVMPTRSNGMKHGSKYHISSIVRNAAERTVYVKTGVQIISGFMAAILKSSVDRHVTLSDGLRLGRSISHT
jgi:hypothetical protein